MRRMHDKLQEKHSQMKSRQNVKLKNRTRFTMYQFPGPRNFHTQLKRIVIFLKNNSVVMLGRNTFKSMWNLDYIEHLNK